MKRILFLIGVFLMLSFTVSAQFVLFKIPVKDAVTKQAIDAKGKIYLVTDTADAHTGNNVFCMEEFGGILEVRIDDKCNNKFRIEVGGTQLIETENGLRWVDSDEYEAESVFIQRKDDMSFPYTLPTVYLKRRSKDQ